MRYQKPAITAEGSSAELIAVTTIYKIPAGGDGQCSEMGLGPCTAEIDD